MANLLNVGIETNPEMETAVTMAEEEIVGVYNKKSGKINFTEMVAEARVERIIADEEEQQKIDPQVAKLKKLTDELLVAMINHKQEGNEKARREIRNEIVVNNMRLVTTVIKKYGYFSADKFQNGCIGLLKAADTFNPEKGVPFSNYAAFCIEVEIRLAYKKLARSFESKKQGYLDSLDEPTHLANGDAVNRHETEDDFMASLPFEEILEVAEIETLFYDIIIPTLNLYGSRKSLGMDMNLWQKLECEYFVGLSMENSQRQRLTFTEMARQLNSTPNNIRARHYKVLGLIREEAERKGYTVEGRTGDFYDLRNVKIKHNKRRAH